MTESTAGSIAAQIIDALGSDELSMTELVDRLRQGSSSVRPTVVKAAALRLILSNQVRLTPRRKLALTSPLGT